MFVDKTTVLGVLVAFIVTSLKIDKDCLIFDSYWNQQYLRLIVDTCHHYGINVLSVKACQSQRKGVHYYIDIDPPVEANVANMLAYLLGDDCQRVDHNRARIESGLNHWSLLFEKPGTRLRTIYRMRNKKERDD